MKLHEISQLIWISSLAESSQVKSIQKQMQMQMQMQKQKKVEVKAKTKAQESSQYPA